VVVREAAEVSKCYCFTVTFIHFVQHALKDERFVLSQLDKGVRSAAWLRTIDFGKEVPASLATPVASPLKMWK
jgi:hypothetical protein